MNYGKQQASKKREKITSKKTMKKKRMGVRFFKAFLLMCLIAIMLGVIGVGALFKKIIDDTPKISADDIRPSAFTTNVMANDGVTVIDTFVDAGSNRVYASIEEIPLNLQNAFIAVEDARFREHNGIDLKGIVRAAVVGITSMDFSQGASTITQQLIKNSIFTDFVNETGFESVERKIQEIYLAIQIEKQLGDKDLILENYLNTINLGQNTLGVQAASRRYFGKDVSELNLSECATIAGITQSPSNLNPITNPEKNNERRLKVLRHMIEQGYITQEEHDEAVADNVYERIQVANTEYTENITVNSYFVDEVQKQVVKDLIDKLGYTETQAHNAVHSGGLTIVTTQDVEIQKICEEELNKDSNYPSTVKWGLSCAITITHADGSQNHYDDYGLKKYMKETYNKDYGTTFNSKEEAEEKLMEYIESLMTEEGDTYLERHTVSAQPQASVVIMDQYTGHVKAIVGGRGEKTGNMSLNRATQSTRQPGSCFKVLAAYSPALDTYGDSLATVIEDAPFKYPSGQQVANWWGNSYKGNMTIRQCIEQSANVCTVKKYTEISPALGYKYLTENFGLTTMDPTNDSGPAACLGGIYNGVYNIEITAAYASIANKGTYTEPIVYTHIYDHDGNLLYEKIPETHVSMKETTAALLTSAMQDVINKGTGTAARLKNMPAAGKTGTSQKSRDLWLCAYTPYLTGSVWTGFDDDQPMEHLNQSFHNRMWKRIMDRINDVKDYEYKSFKMPASIGSTTVCADTGKLPSSEFCTVASEYFAPGTYPSQSCPGHPDKEEEARLEEERLKAEEEERLRLEEEERKKQEALLNGGTVAPSTP